MSCEKFKGDYIEYYIGVDIGGTSIKFLIFKNDKIMDKFSIKTNLSNNGENILNEISFIICEFANNNNITYEEIKAIGVGVPGPVVENNVLFCVNIFWKEKNVVKELGDLLPFKVFITCINDANAALYSEVNEKYDKAIMLTLGTGVGGGIYIHDIIEGANGSTGEFGHINIDDKYNFKCNCGLTGCLETVASANGIENIYKYKTGIDRKCIEIFKNINDDKFASEAVEEVCMYLGKVCANIATIINPQIIIIGGGMSLAKDVLLERIIKYFKKFAFKSIKNTEIILSQNGSDSGGIGGALYAKKKWERISKS